MRVLIIDPGYSLKKAVEDWKQGNYPGHILYGVNHFKENGIEPIFEERTVKIAEKSRGHSKFKVIKSRLRSELHNANECIKHKDCDCVYLPVTNFAVLLCAFRKMGIIRKPIIGLIHGINTEGKKKWLYRLYFSSLDKIVFIADSTYKQFQKHFEQYQDKARLVELSAELDEPINELNKYDFCLIGKTHRDYRTVAEAAKILHRPAIIVGGVDAWNYKNEFVEIRENLPWNECKRIYCSSRVNVIALHEAGGIYGFTSILDSFSLIRPMIVSLTDQIPINPEELGVGLSVAPNNADELARKLDTLLSNSELYQKCQEKIRLYRLSHNSSEFAKEIAKLMRDTISSR